MVIKETLVVLKNSTKPKSMLDIGQQGMAAILVTTVLISVIGLIVIGFSLTVRRNQRETLDRQLSTQAYYAAESGVNAARAIAANRFVNGLPLVDQTDCGHGGSPVYTAPVLSANVSVTCLEVTNNNKVLKYNGVNSDKDTVVPVVSSDGTIINKISLRWTPAAYMRNMSDCNSLRFDKLPPASTWVAGCKYGLIRADVVKDISGAPLARTVFIKPKDGGVPNIDLPSGITGYVVNAGCDTSKCLADIDTSPSSQYLKNSSSYFLRIRSLYLNTDSLEVSAYDAGGVQLNLSGQISIDATGKAQDVLRRVNVRVPVTPRSNNLPLGAIESAGDVCKRFSVAPNIFSGGDTADKAYCKN